MIPVDIEYFKPTTKSEIEKTNSLGFRGKEFNPDKNNILIAGCSIHFGAFVDEQCIFSNLLVERLGEDYGYLNISVPGSGIDMEIKNIIWALSNFKFEKILWLMPNPVRGFYYHEHVGILPYNPGFDYPWFSSIQGKNWVDVRISNDYDITRKALDQIELLFLLFKTLKLDSYVSSWNVNMDNNISSLRSKFNIKSLPQFPRLDIVGNSQSPHPGIKSHDAYADALYQLIKN